MDSADKENKQGAPAPETVGPVTSSPDSTEKSADGVQDSTVPAEDASSQVSHEPVHDATDSYTYYDDYGSGQPHPETPKVAEATDLPVPVPATSSTAMPPPPPTAPPAEPGEDDDEDGMLRMSFLEHLEELRARLLRCLIGIGLAFVASLYFTKDLWEIVKAPAVEAMIQVGIKDPRLYVLEPTEAFSIIWVKLPVLTAIFLASPWVLYQVWSFIAPGLYKRERRWAVPFVVFSAGLFILGGLFAYFVAFKLGLAFLLGLAVSNDVNQAISITRYFDLFVNVSLGMGLVFELPVLIFFLSLLRILSPSFLVRNSRYAILLIVVVAAIITPTPDVINLMLISVPMTVLYFGGVLASYLLFLHREGKRFPWGILLLVVSGLLLTSAGLLYLAVTKYGYHLIRSWPFLVK